MVLTEAKARHFFPMGVSLRALCGVGLALGLLAAIDGQAARGSVHLAGVEPLDFGQAAVSFSQAADNGSGSAGSLRPEEESSSAEELESAIVELVLALTQKDATTSASGGGAIGGGATSQAVLGVGSDIRAELTICGRVVDPSFQLPDSTIRELFHPPRLS